MLFEDLLSVEIAWHQEVKKSP